MYCEYLQLQHFSLFLMKSDEFIGKYFISCFITVFFAIELYSVFHGEFEALEYCVLILSTSCLLQQCLQSSLVVLRRNYHNQLR